MTTDKKVNKPKSPDEKLPVVEVTPGYGRFCAWCNKEQTHYILTFYGSPVQLVPGVAVVPPDEDREKWEPLIGIAVSDPRSADVWADAFKGLAKNIRKDEKAKLKKAIKQAVIGLNSRDTEEELRDGPTTA